MRRRLFLVTLAVTTLLVAAFAIPLALLVRDVARDRAISDAEADQAALAPVLAVNATPESLADAIETTPSGRDGRFAVVLPDGTQIGDQTELNEDSVSLARDRQTAFSESVEGGIDVYSPVVLGTGDVVALRVHVPDSLATEGVATSWLVLGLVALVLLVVAVVATDRLARSVTRPAAELANTSRALAGGDPHARAAVAGPPEIADVAEALNLLADRIDQLRVAERERAADLSHRLRTPLTALRLDAERHGDADLNDDVDRLEAEVSELIRAARRPLHEEVAVRSDLAEVLEERADFWGALADDDGRPWECHVEPAGPHPVRLPRDDAAAAVDVLLGNVFAHTPEGTPYAMGVRGAGDRVELSVEDGGAGIAGIEDLLDRGSSLGGSTGLGLDIAASAARAAGGELRVDRSDRLGGARVVLDLPRGGEPVTSVEDAVRAEVMRRGPIPFDEVMALALYDPESGFYSAVGEAGRRGDFITSPEVGPLFGAVVARALDAWWEDAGQPEVFTVVEAGAGPGTLARSILAAAPRCARALRYVLVEVSDRQRARHAAHLELDPPAFAFASPPDPETEEATVAVATGPIVVSLADLPRSVGPCIVLANELLDNLPVGLRERTEAGWDEVRVGVDGATLTEVVVAGTTAPGPGAPLGARLPTAQAAADWVRDAVALAAPGGRVVAFDYASTTEELAQRPWQAWLRTYRQHERGGHPLEHLGSQDVTSEVPVDQLPTPARDVSQAEWLREHGIDELVAEGRATWRERAAVGDLEAVRARSRVTEADALLDPAGLGAFRVLEWEGR